MYLIKKVNKIYSKGIRLFNNFLDLIISQESITRKIILYLIDIFSLLLTIFYTSWVLNIFNSESIITEYKKFFIILFLLFIPFNILCGTYKAVSKFVQSLILYKFFIKNSFLFLIIIFTLKLLNINSPHISVLTLLIICLSTILSLSRLMFRDYLIFSKKHKHENLNRTIIYGAGSAGASLCNMISDTNNIIGFIDDNEKLWGRYLYDIKIYSPKKLFSEKKDIDQVLIAIPTLKKKRIREIINFLNNKDVTVMKVPSLDQILNHSKKIADLENIKIEDLLERDEIIANKNLLNQAIHEKVVMITGAAGSIGSEMAEKVIKLNPKQVILIDMNESAVYKLNQKINSLNFNLNNIKIILGDIKFEPLLTKIFQNYKVDIVFHAAAYKHVPLVENNPIEGIRNNIFATISLFKLTNLYGVKKVILISSDKAVRPSNIMGCSKRICELVFLHYSAKKQATKYSIVRFGNVIGSSGSVIPLFSKQLSNGGPITLTHPNITRYFMTIAEATELVIQTSALTLGRDVFILDMGEPLKIIDLAKKMIKLSGLKLRDKAKFSNEIEIKYTGLRPGEKMYEELLVEPNSSQTSHPLIFKANERKELNFEFEELLKQLNVSINKNDEESVFKIIKKIVPEWKENFIYKKSKFIN